MLSDRRQRVLAALIEEYVARALPVGSRTLAERYKLGVSPATVRNELSILEDEGYIAQPHTSAGRIPTDFGYRTFVDDLLANDSLPDEERYRAVAEDLRKSASELDSLLEQTSSALARLTDCLSIVLAPTVLETRVKQIDAREPYGVSRYLRCRDRRRQCLQPPNGLHHPRRQRRAFAHPGPAQQGTLREIALRRGTRPVVWHEARLLRSARTRSARRGALLPSRKGRRGAPTSSA